MNDVLEEYKEIFAYLVEKKNVCDNDEYINWLKSKVDDGTTLVYEDDNSCSKLSILAAFFDKINEYANNNHIKGTQDFLDIYYGIKYNGETFVVGANYNFKNTYYFKKVFVEDDSSFISFHDVVYKYDDKEKDTVTKLIREIK